jgi:hypothetical protein
MRAGLEHGSSEVPPEGRSSSTQAPSGTPATAYGAPQSVIVQLDRRRVVDDGIQWIVQRHIGGRWRDLSYHRSRRVLIERFGVGTSELEALPEFYSQPHLTDWPRCKVCGRWESLPRDNLPRHMFCLAVRKRAS